MKKLLKLAIDCLPASAADKIYACRHRVYWILGKGTQFHGISRHKPQIQILEVVNDWLKESARPALRVLELGCSDGNNLELLRNGLAIPIRYVGFDIQANAIAAARERFPDDTFVLGDDRRLVEIAPHLGTFDLFLVSALFYYLPQKRVKDVLSAIVSIADFTLVSDYLDRFDCADGVRDGLFLHPYSRLCSDAKLEIVRQPRKSPPYYVDGKRRHDIFLARSLVRQSDVAGIPPTGFPGESVRLFGSQTPL
jgi:SAM-dependent methyltransferase